MSLPEQFQAFPFRTNLFDTNVNDFLTLFVLMYRNANLFLFCFIFRKLSSINNSNVFFFSYRLFWGFLPKSHTCFCLPMQTKTYSQKPKISQFYVCWIICILKILLEVWKFPFPLVDTKIFFKIINAFYMLSNTLRWPHDLNF